MSLPHGRRVLVARVTGVAGDRIEAWRRRYDLQQALRLPAHATLCYWAPGPERLALLDAQIRYAFETALPVRLGPVRQFDNDDGTLYVEVLDTAALDRARARLFDATHLGLGGRSSWTWHITCVRAARNRSDQVALGEAARSLHVNGITWTVDTLSYMELRGDRYASLYDWALPAPGHAAAV